MRMVGITVLSLIAFGFGGLASAATAGRGVQPLTSRQTQRSPSDSTDLSDVPQSAVPGGYQTPYTKCRSAHPEDPDAGNDCGLDGTYRRQGMSPP